MQYFALEFQNECFTFLSEKGLFSLKGIFGFEDLSRMENKEDLDYRRRKKAPYGSDSKMRFLP